MSKKSSSAPESGVEPSPASPIAGTVGTVETPGVGIPIGGFVEAAIDPFAHIGDEHWGKGGSYVVDKGGKRVPAPVVADPANPVTTEKEPING